MATDIDFSKHFRRLDDGRYLFRADRWSRTVILDVETARRVHDGRERYLRKSVRRNTAIGFLGVGLGSGLHRSDKPLVTILLLVGIALVVGFWDKSLRERAYYKWVRSAPTSERSFPVSFGFQENLQRAAAVQPLSPLILSSALGTLVALFFFAASVYSLIDDPFRGETLILFAGALFMAAATAVLAYQWRLKRRLLHALRDGQKPPTEVG